MTRHNFNLAFFIVAGLLAGAVCHDTTAADERVVKDWGGLLGEHRDGIVNTPLEIAGAGLEDDSRRKWRYPVGAGFAGPAVSDGKIIAFHRKAGTYHVDCLNKVNGKKLWGETFAATYRDDFGFDDGPRAVPLIEGDRVTVFSPEGLLHCYTLADGKLLWKLDVVERYGSSKGFFGRVCSPVVGGDVLIIQVGGETHGIVGLNKKTGEHLWGATKDEASYSSPVVRKIGGELLGFCYTRTGLVVLRVKDGKVLDQFDWRPAMHASVNAASPVVVGNEVFISTSYGQGGALLRLTDGKLKKVWTNDTSMSNHYATCVYRDGMLFGFHGRQEQGPSLRCVDWKTGKVHWDKEDLGAGTVIVVNDKLVVLTENGLLRVIKASKAGYEKMGEVQMLGFKTRAYPAYSEGFLFARDTRQLVCYDLRK